MDATRLKTVSLRPKSPDMPNIASQGAAPAPSGEPIVSITGLSKTYKGGFQALKDVSL